MKSKRAQVTGIARNVVWRDEIFTFRIECTDEEGNISRMVSVQLEGKLKGNVVDGDEIEVTGNFDQEGVLKPREIRNLRTNTTIRVGSGKGMVLFALPIVLAIIGLVIGVVGTGEIEGALSGAMFGFLAGCVLCVFVFIAMTVMHSFRR